MAAEFWIMTALALLTAIAGHNRVSHWKQRAQPADSAPYEYRFKCSTGGIIRVGADFYAVDEAGLYCPRCGDVVFEHPDNPTGPPAPTKTHRWVEPRRTVPGCTCRQHTDRCCISLGIHVHDCTVHYPGAEA